MFKTILFPIDMSPEAQQVANLVVQLVQQHQSQLILLSVVEANRPGQASPEAVAQLLSKAKDLFSEHSIQSETVEREGQPAFVICDVADELNVDLVVMGCRGIGLIEESSTESVTNRVINLAPCPVLIVP